MLPEIAIGAIVAAIIGAMISLVSLVISKESKVSEFRQAWIDSLRSELSAFASNLNALCDANMIDFGSPAERFEKMKEHTTKLNESLFSVALRLNVAEETSEKVKMSMVKLAQSVKNPDCFEKHQFDIDQVNFIENANALLKQEWKRVKAGEPVYKWTRRISAFTIAALSVGIIIAFTSNLISEREQAISPPLQSTQIEKSAVSAKGKSALEGPSKAEGSPIPDPTAFQGSNTQQPQQDAENSK